jgi:hypothetical protein
MALIYMSVLERNHNLAGRETPRKIAYGKRSMGVQGDVHGMLLVPALASDETLHFCTKWVGATGMALVEFPALVSGGAADFRFLDG